MRTCGIVVLIASLVVSIHCMTDIEKTRQREKTYDKECQDDPNTQIDGAMLRKYLIGEHIAKSVAGAYVLCMSSKFGYVSQESKVSKSGMKKVLAPGILDETKLNDIVEKCAVETGDPQDTAMAVTRCIREEAGYINRQHHHHQ